MNAKFKHRLLGTSILLMLAIIFLPDLLDGEKQVSKDDFKIIPERPEFQGVVSVPAFEDEAVTTLVTAAATEQPDVVADSAKANATAELPSEQFASVTLNASGQATVSQPRTSPVAADSTTQAAANSELSSASSTANTPPPTLTQAAWIVRVGSFSNQQNANALVIRLRQEGFTTFSRQITNSNGQVLTSVFVGPEIRRERLEQGLPKLQQLTGVERLVISNYQPTENN